jgi:hypothetical protein
LEKRIPEEISRGNQRRHRETVEVLIQDWDTDIINDVVRSEDYKKEMLMVLEKNKIGNRSKRSTSNKPFKFYTDGSLINRGREDEYIRMGAAWIQIEK